MATLLMKSIGEGTGQIRIPETDYKNYRAKARERGNCYNGY